jgi:putative hydrolase of the HAD superfamily
MILIFDLDDTLYEEMSFVRSGLQAVAAYGRMSFGWDEGNSYEFMYEFLLKNGRGRVFDEWLNLHQHFSNSRLKKCVHLYRHHIPKITLSKETLQILSRFQDLYPMYLVTDGHKIVQQKKIAALGIEPFFKRVFITHRFGIRHAKPSLYCFERIRQLEKCPWSNLVYVGDNPAKDFVSLNSMGALTIRVNTGVHAEVLAQVGFDARHTIDNIAHLPLLVDNVASNFANPIEEVIRGNHRCL